MDPRFSSPHTPSFYDHEGRSPIHSTASAPSLRSPNPVYMAAMRGAEPPGGNVKVVVRVRKFLARENERGAKCLVDMNPQSEETTLLPPDNDDPANSKTNTRKIIEPKNFTFDRSFWSHDRSDEHYADQEEVYNSLGEEMLDHNFEGYHTCIFAYGQTGSGKSYTMMGTPEEQGIIPRTCQDLFERIESNDSPTISYSVRVSYFEVYNEHVRDLLVPRADPPHYLKIRESPTEGPYIKDLTDQPVRNYSDIVRLIEKGDHSRTTASTKMNDTSSRSHAVFTIMLKQIHADITTDETTERVARIRLVDLAGSERQKATQAVGQRLREGSNINRSLTTLGRVIAALADASTKGSGLKKKGRQQREVVPYRDSILTWLLKDSLGGNSKTAMIACVAPSDYDETLSTLRYADQAKRIKTRAVVNQDHISSAERDAQIVEMQDMIRKLQLDLSQRDAKEQTLMQQAASNQQATALRKDHERQTQQLEEYHEYVKKMQQTMEETKQVCESKIQALRTENEALRRHLKLAVESLRNPVVVPAPSPAPVRLPPLESEAKEEAKSAPETVQPSLPSTRAVTPEPVQVPIEEPGEAEHWDEESDTDVEDNAMHSQATEIQAQMADLLKDLGMFKRKLGDDHARFIDADTGQTMQLVRV